MLAVWRRIVSLSWPVATEQLFSTLMRTTDVIITALFSPAAVAAVGLADLYAQLSMRVGSGLGGGAIALSSQDTGRGAATDRDEAITQALLIGTMLGLPLIVFGLFFSEWAISVLGADTETVALGSIYLTIIMLSSPMRIIGIIGTKSLQGTGNTRTPMYINVSSYFVNIVGSVTLGLGILAPKLGIIGVGLGTAAGNTVAGVGVLLAIYSPQFEASFARPRKIIITKQLLAVSAPRTAEGLITTVVYFPFNALLLVFGTEVNAGYHIGRRIYHQVAGPLYRSYNTTASIIVGQSLGKGDSEQARFNGYAHAAFSFATLAAAGAVLFVGADWFVSLLTDDVSTITYAVGFSQTFAVSMLFIALFFSFSGSLQGAGETRIPLVARVTGLFGSMLGLSYLLGVTFGYGVYGAYVGIIIMYLWWALIVAGSFVWGNWQNRATSMMSARREASEDANTEQTPEQESEIKTNSAK